MFVLLILSVALSFIINLAITPLIIRLSDENNWYDYYDAKQKIHKFNTSRLGGIGIFVSFIVSLIVVSLLADLLFEASNVQIFTPQRIFMLAGFFIAFAIGLIDDFKNIPATVKLLGQIFAGLLISFGGISVQEIYIPIIGLSIQLGVIAPFVVAFWLVSISNALNVVDGYDGHTGSISLCACIALGIIQTLAGNVVSAVFCFALSGALLAFLRYNKPLAQIFMGDSGALFLGIAISSIAFIQDNPYVIAAESNSLGLGAKFAVCITLLISPILEMLIAMANRIRKGQSIFYPDNLRYYHKLLNMGLSIPKILGFSILHSLLLLLVVVLHSVLSLQGLFVLADFLLVSSWLATLIILLGIHRTEKTSKK